MSTRRTLGRDFSQIVFYIDFLLKYFSTWIRDIELFSYCKKTRNVFNIILHKLMRELEKSSTKFLIRFNKANNSTMNCLKLFCIDIKLTI